MKRRNSVPAGRNGGRSACREQMVLYPVPTGIEVVERRIADSFGIDDGRSRLYAAEQPWLQRLG